MVDLMKIKSFLCLLIIVPIAFADISDLEKLVNELNQQPIPQINPKLPEYKLANTSYRSLSSNNLFSASRMNESGDENYLNRYNLNQLQMVGFLNYQKTNYAFIKTPFETLRVKVGDKIQNGQVTLINESSLEIIERQTQGDRTYDKKIFLQLNESKSNKLPKL